MSSPDVVKALSVEFAYNEEDDLIKVELSFGMMALVSFILPAEEAKRFGQQMIDYTLNAQSDRKESKEDSTGWETLL